MKININVDIISIVVQYWQLIALFFSRMTSGMISPSELPDSPTQTVPPSPHSVKPPVPIPGELNYNRKPLQLSEALQYSPFWTKVCFLEDNLHAAVWWASLKYSLFKPWGRIINLFIMFSEFVLLIVSLKCTDLISFFLIGQMPFNLVYR